MLQAKHSGLIFESCTVLHVVAKNQYNTAMQAVHFGALDSFIYESRSSRQVPERPVEVAGFFTRSERVQAHSQGWPSYVTEEAFHSLCIGCTLPSHKVSQAAQSTECG